MGEARETGARCESEHELDAVAVRDARALWTLAMSTKPWVSTSRCRFLPLTFLAPSYPRSFPPTPVVLIDWLSTMAALG